MSPRRAVVALFVTVLFVEALDLREPLFRGLAREEGRERELEHFHATLSHVVDERSELPNLGFELAARVRAHLRPSLSCEVSLRHRSRARGAPRPRSSARPTR